MKERIALLIERSGKAQRKIAEEVGVSPATVGYWARAERTPTADDAVRLAKALDVSLQYLCTGEGGHYLSQTDYKLRSVTGDEADQILQNMDVIKLNDFSMFRKMSDDLDKIANVYLRRERYREGK